MNAYKAFLPENTTTSPRLGAEPYDDPLNGYYQGSFNLPTTGQLRIKELQGKASRTDEESEELTRLLTQETNKAKLQELLSKEKKEELTTDEKTQLENLKASTETSSSPVNHIGDWPSMEIFTINKKSTTTP